MARIKTELQAGDNTFIPATHPADPIASFYRNPMLTTPGPRPRRGPGPGPGPRLGRGPERKEAGPGNAMC